MAGYSGYSMSNNAVDAYEAGEKPISHWTKKVILNEVEDAVISGEIVLKCSFENLSKLPAEELKSRGLYVSSWHHTSSRYNKTDFYSIDFDYFENLTDDEIDTIIREHKEYKNSDSKIEVKKRNATVEFTEWSGTRKHPKATKVVKNGYIKGDYFYYTDIYKERKKWLLGNWIRIISIDEE